MSVASWRLAPQDPRLSGHDGTMMLNGAYLVEIAEEAAFAATVDKLAAVQTEVRVAFRGPLTPILVRDVGAGMSADVTTRPTAAVGQIALVDLLDRLLGSGVVLAGDVVISLSGVDLVQVRLHALITSVRADMMGPG
jgi:hypothetical protein